MIDWQVTKWVVVFYVAGLIFYLFLGSGYFGHTVGCLIGWAITQAIIYRNKKRHEK